MNLAVDALRLSLGGREILDHLSLHVAGGELVALCGPNGAGKSTLLDCIAGDRAPDRGLVRLDGDPLETLADAEQAGRRSVLVQMPALHIGFSALRVVGLGSPGQSPARRLALLEELGMAEVAQRAYTSLSGGEQRLVQLARVLLQADLIAARRGSALILLDEPSAHLDPVMASRALHALARRAEAGAAILLASHDIELVSRHASRMVLMRAGRIIADATVDAIGAEAIGACYGAPARIHRTGDGAGIRVEFPSGVS